MSACAGRISGPDRHLGYETLDFMQRDLDADAYKVISAWVARAIREIRADLARVQAIDPEALEGLPAARMALAAYIWANAAMSLKGFWPRQFFRLEYEFW